MQFLSRETRGWVGEGRRAVLGSWKERTSERYLLGEEWSLPKRDDAVHFPGQMGETARFAPGRWKIARTRHIHVTGEKIATMMNINRLD